ncbi:MAG: glycosyltransferase [Planctomycetaceae bacterium]|nr:glycosyltransferase [Planctomycetaceae bacterium]
MTARPSKRILMISTHGYVAAQPELGKPDTGGQVVFVLKLAECLGRMGYKVDVMTRRFEDQSAIEKLDANVRVLRFPCGGKEFIGKEWLCDSIPEWIENAAAFIRKRHLKYSFINSHYWDAGLAGQGLAEEFSIPHFHTPHSIGAWKRDNMDGDPEENERKYNFQRRVEEEQKLYAACDLVIATTEEQRELLQKDVYQVPDERLTVIPPGYDDRQFYPVSAATRQSLKQDLDATGPIVLALGRMAHNKGYDLLIRSFSTVHKRVPDARLLLAVGSTDPSKREIEQIEELRQLARELGLENQVLFRDYIPDDLLADYFRIAEVFALSSRYEPFGMTAVEAMACGTPAVVTTQGGLWKMLTWGRDTIYANPFDTDEYGHALATLLQYPEVAARLAERGAQTARALFTWTGIAQQLVSVVHAADSSPPSRTSPHRSTPVQVPAAS